MGKCGDGRDAVVGGSGAVRRAAHSTYQAAVASNIDNDGFKDTLPLLGRRSSLPVCRLHMRSPGYKGTTGYQRWLRDPGSGCLEVKTSQAAVTRPRLMDMGTAAQPARVHALGGRR